MVDNKFEQISIINHQDFHCIFKNFVFVGEQRNGLYNEFVFNCTVCGKKEVIESENANALF